MLTWGRRGRGRGGTICSVSYLDSLCGPPTPDLSNVSWIDDGTVSGLGWFYNDPMGVERFGLQWCRKSLSALHAEMEGFIWTMSCLRELHFTAVQMETDCSELVDMIANPFDWPAFASELVSFWLLRDGFLEFRITRIPMTRICVQILSLRRRDVAVLFFPYRSDPAGQNVSSERLKPAYHLILEDGRLQKKIVCIYNYLNICIYMHIINGSDRIFVPSFLNICRILNISFCFDSQRFTDIWICSNHDK